MGPNPMQKMKRNSILIGLVVGLLIGLIMCAALYFFLTQTEGISNINGENAVSACILNKTIKAGSKITDADVMIVNVNKENAPIDITLQVIGGVAKIDLSAGTILGTSMLNTSNEVITADLREQEYSMVVLPSQLSVGDFIDIRLQMPNGGDYIVVSKKQVVKCDATNISLNMREEEIDLMSNAVIEYYIMPGSKLYATIYKEPGLQTAAIGTYVPNASVSNLISNNPNIKEYINTERYSEALKNIRNQNINSALNPYYIDPDGDGKTEALDNIEKNIQEEIRGIKESREAYFGALNSAY